MLNIRFFQNEHASAHRRVAVFGRKGADEVVGFYQSAAVERNVVVGKQKVCESFVLHHFRHASRETARAAQVFVWDYRINVV